MIEPQLEVLHILALGDITPAHLEHLPALAEANWTGVSALDIVDEIRMGRVRVWGREGYDGIVLTRIEDAPGERRLILDGIAGSGILARWRAVGRDIQLIARYYGAHRVEVSSNDPRWARVGKLLGFAPVTTVYSMEVDYVGR